MEPRKWCFTRTMTGYSLKTLYVTVVVVCSCTAFIIAHRHIFSLNCLTNIHQNVRYVTYNSSIMKYGDFNFTDTNARQFSNVRSKSSNYYTRPSASLMDVNKSNISSRKPCFRLIWDEREFFKMVKQTDHAMNQSDDLNAIPDECRRFVTIKTPLGRLGNLMFEIASLIGIAHAHDLIPVFHPILQEKVIFKLPNVLSLKLTNSVDIKSKRCCEYSEGLSRTLSKHVNVTMHGYFQSWKYFRDVFPIIRKIFTLSRGMLSRPKRLLNFLPLSNIKKVCVHVRRGDITEYRHFYRGHVFAGTKYLQTAMDFYKNNYANVHFIIISDDTDWCKDNIQREKHRVTFSPFTFPGYDLAMMTLCDDVIITTGTFGWWGAWLSGGTVIYFDGNPRPGSPMYTEFKAEDYFPPGWIGMH